MLRELILKRSSDYDNISKEIVSLYENNLVKALQLYMNVSRKFHIKSVTLHPQNDNFAINELELQFFVGDSIVLIDGSEFVVTENNISQLKHESLKITLPISILENGSVHTIHEKLKSIESFIDKFSMETYQKCIQSGITDLDDLEVDAKYIKLLDEITDPSISIIDNLDPLQKLDYELYSKQLDKVKH